MLKLADQGAAALDGRLQVGDQILEINGYDAYQMTHSEAIDRIKSGGNYVTLLIRRTGMPPPSITDIIAANTSTSTSTPAAAPVQPSATSGPNQIGPSVSINNLNGSSDVQLRAKSPYFPQQTVALPPSTQPVKHFNSSGALINRNY